MSPEKLDFLRRLIAERPTERRSQVAHRVADEDGIGRVHRRAVLYSPVDYDLASKILANRGFALVAAAPGGARADASDAASEKAGADLVTEGLVAVVPMGLPQQRGHAPVGSFLAMRWDAALALPYEVLVVCENLEPMLRLSSYPWLIHQIAGRPALALFRGAPAWFRTNAAAQLVASDRRPLLALFDFDPQGLAMANALPRRERLCLPPWEELEALVRQYKRHHLYANQVQRSRVELDACEAPDIAEAWRRMRTLACGLNQEAFPQEHRAQ